MYLKRVEITGFKSFANKTRLELEPGITAVVGPNGAGKSNIADAIRWAMGEQSSRNLRLKKNEEVVFAGTQRAFGFLKRPGGHPTWNEYLDLLGNNNSLKGFAERLRTFGMRDEPLKDDAENNSSSQPPV